MTRKLVALLSAAVMMVSLVSCGGQTQNTPSPNQSNPSQNQSNTSQNQSNEPAYPTKAITVIVPYQAGSQMDLVTRAFVTRMEETLGVPFAIENVVGADGVTGHIQLASAAADGYTIGCASASPLCVSPYMEEGIPYDYESFEYIGLYQPYMHGVAVQSSSSVTNLDELIELAKSKDIVCGYAGTVNLVNISKIMKAGGVDMNKVTIVPYNSNDVMPALAGGFLDFAVHSNSTIGPMVQSGDVRLIAPLGEDRWECDLNVPSSVEQGYDMLYSFGGLSLAAPKGIPSEYLEILRDAFEEATHNQDYIDMLVNQGYSPYFLVGDECYNRVKSDAESALNTLTELGMAK